MHDLIRISPCTGSALSYGLEILKNMAIFIVCYSLITALPISISMKICFPKNSSLCTSFLQPADQGMIACLKVGYKALMLKKLLAICDDDILCQEALKPGKKVRNSCRGLEYCGKAHVLDAMEICFEIWNNDGKYAKEESIRRCWRNAGLLTATEEADL